MWLIELFFLLLNSANLICRGTDISKYFRESLGIRDNESRLYFDIRYSFSADKTSHERYYRVYPKEQDALTTSHTLFSASPQSPPPIEKINTSILLPVDVLEIAGCVENNVDLDQTARSMVLDKVVIVCSRLSVAIVTASG